MKSLIIVAFLALIACVSARYSPMYHVKACEGHHLNLRCPVHSTIEIHYAMYGRTNKVDCRTWLWWGFYLNNCKSGHSMYKTKIFCQGRNHCSIRAGNFVFGDPCFGTPKYLDVKYRCKGQGDEPQ